MVLGKYKGSGYWVSSYGRIKGKRGRILKERINQTGYNEVVLTVSGTPNYVRAHVLVAKAFLGKPYSLRRLEVNHKDGNKLNNRVENLEWVTRSENLRHAYATGLRDGMKRYRRLSKTQYQLVFRLRHEVGMSGADIGRIFGVNRGIVNNILAGKTYTEFVDA